MNWSDFHNKHMGETGLIIGNGPSLNEIPLDFLKSYPSFGSNRIYLKFEPDYYASVNPLVVSQYCHEIDKIKSVKFISETQGVHWMIQDCLSLRSNGMAIFSFWPDKWIYEGHTVTYVLMQLAYYMGFKRILLVGVDHRFTYDGAPNEQRKMEGADPNHFDPNYFAGAQWNNPDLEMSAKAYRMAQVAYTNNNREIINITPGSALDIFPKQDWRTWILD